jgi:hypothetical protein
LLLEVPAYKDGRGRWVVRRANVERGLKAEREEQERSVKAGADYARHVLHGREGERIWTDSGYYERRGDFHIWFDPYVAPWDGDGLSWRCNACWRQAAEEHRHDYCLRCWDGSECRSDCTLGAVRCGTCDVRMEIPADPDLYRAKGTAPDWRR